MNKLLNGFNNGINTADDIGGIYPKKHKLNISEKPKISKINREIKFRFWINDKPVLKSLSEFLMNDGTKERTLIGFHNPFEINQFAGYSDKNKKDVYEHDIVKCFELFSLAQWYSKIYFIAGSFCVKKNSHYLNINDEDLIIEVWSNTHDNPDFIDTATEYNIK